MKRILVLVPVLVLLLLAGRPALADGGHVYLRVIHAVPNAPAVNVLVDGRIPFCCVSYGHVTSYTKLEPDTSYNLKVITADRPQNLVIDTDIDPELLEPGTRFTALVAAGVDNGAQLLLIEDDTEPAEWGKAKVRVVHASPDAGPVDVAIKGGDILFDAVEYPQVRDGEVDAGTYNLEVRIADSSDPDDVLLSIPWLSLPSGSTSTLVVIGLAGGEPDLSYLHLFSARYRSHWGPKPVPPYWGIRYPGWYPGYFPPPVRHYPPPKYYPYPYRGPHYYW